jgi:hypothetical protein
MLSTRTKHKYNAVIGKEWDNRDTNYRLPHWKLWVLCEPELKRELSPLRYLLDMGFPVDGVVM